MSELGVRPSAAGFLWGLGTAIGILALSSLLLLLPPAGTVLMVTFAPLAAGYYGARAGHRRSHSGWLLLGISAALIWSAVEAGLILTVLAEIMGTVMLDPIGLAALAVGIASNVIFCALGARLGAAGAAAS
jgi:hypothetical protein